MCKTKSFIRVAGAALLLAAIVTLITQTGSVTASSHDPDAPALPNGCDVSTYRPGQPYGFSWCPDGGYVTPDTGYVAPGSPDFHVDAPPNPVGCPGNPGTPTITNYCSDGSYVVNNGDSLPEAESNQIAIDRLGLPRTPSPTLDTFMDILNLVFMIAGALATIFIVVGALRFVISAGNPEGIERAKGTITYAVIGLVVTVFAFAIVNFVISSL